MSESFRYVDPKALRAMHPAPSVQGSETSEAAARAMPDSQRKIDKARIVAAMRAAGSNGLTDEEGQRLTGIAGDTYRPRRGELLKDNLIVKARRKRMTRSGREAEVWIAR